LVMGSKNTAFRSGEMIGLILAGRTKPPNAHWGRTFLLVVCAKEEPKTSRQAKSPVNFIRDFFIKIIIIGLFYSRL